MTQISFIELTEQAEKIAEYAKLKNRWENAFQKWSNTQWNDSYTSFGKCGYGSICDWCKDNSYGRPCVRALNMMLREKKITVDYDDYDFTKWW